MTKYNTKTIQIYSKTYFILIFISLFLFSLIGGYSQAEEKLEAKLLQPFSKEQQSFAKKNIVLNTYKTFDGLKNYYAQVDNPEGTITSPLIILTGLDDPIPLWIYTIQKAVKYGFKKIYVFELRGQGFSEKATKTAKKLNTIFIKDFHNYCKDFTQFLGIAKGALASKVQGSYILAHSTGGLVVSNCLKDIQNKVPKLYPLKMTLWTPLFRIKTSYFLDNKLVRSFLGLVDRISLAFGKLILVSKNKAFNPKDNPLSTDANKTEIANFLRFNQGLGGKSISLTWVLEAMKASLEFRRKNYKNIDMPVLIFNAENEQVVDNTVTPKNPQFIIQNVLGAKHGLNIEQPAIYNNVVNKSFYFLTHP